MMFADFKIQRTMLMVTMMVLLFSSAIFASPVETTVLNPAAVNAKYCYITSKNGKDCNVNTCKAGGGTCDLNAKTNRCNQGGSFSTTIECKTNCKCAAGNN